MRWSCPHCGVNLAVSDEKLGSGWSFSRCYKCGGFALVRKSEVNLIKVDKAPVGENILLPEANESPVLSRDAAKNLAEIVSNVKPAGIPAEPPPAANSSVAPPVPKFLTQNQETTSSSHSMLNHVVSARTQYRILPMAIGLTGFMAVASGVYLYIQGEAIWKKIQAPRGVARNTPAEIVKPIIEPGSPPIITAAVTSLPLVTDQLRQSAMAPARPVDSNAKAVQEALDSADELEDESSSAAVENNLTVRVRAANTKLRSGPGVSYSIRGYANPTTEFTVLDWRDRWFKVGPRSAANSHENSAWIRNDLVEIIRDK
ncbi:MAG TPA: hypothetical protein DCS07_15050 [Bdellovibrionales bacterium]|nr:MAG: hypothetical protein A2Z97_10160 [Bdellovibrionales bacterium GWB1_52_6]OFZ05281.1 MAG: hypothetical protein A2X97_10870 [Bdellovibrionales bacterium GWA1_52_35]OFZ42167.1 MAG: hypothetical protein A2070_07550 [Bdellovibrionales bacterium GWC1_52_8]HAR43928.1 hypothetical protein [Bdellovibrionales bacterium]HCM38581.1 hypothetical protein [Bdellovibrionales bacterium]